MSKMYVERSYNYGREIFFFFISDFSNFGGRFLRKRRKKIPIKTGKKQSFSSVSKDEEQECWGRERERDE